MVTSAAAAAPAAAAPQGQGGGNPFWEVTNLFAQKNKQGTIISQQLGAATIDGGGAINPGNFLRGLRLIVRSSGGVAGSPTPDNPFSAFRRLGLQNTDGAEIMYNALNGFAYAQRQRFGRPWLQDPATAYDYAQGINPSFTLFMQPEVRQQLGALENTDTRSQYQWTQTLGLSSDIATGATTATTLSVTPFCDMWAQPDGKDLEGIPNQPVPPGVNLQTKTRHQVFQLNSAGSTNSLLSTLTGNAVRLCILIVRDSNNARQDYLSEPIVWTQDSRNLGTLSPDVIFQWMQDQYAAYGGRSRPAGVYVFPRFYNPGELYGQGWLYTANSTALLWESTTAAGAVNVPGTIELLQEEIYAVGAVDPSLIDL